MIGVGLLYNHGYFIQRINQEGWQEASYKPLDFSTVPAEKAIGTDGREIVVQIEMPDRIVSARVWAIKVGRITLYLLDTDIEQNTVNDRGLSARLYGGDNQMRIAQEKILGIGGVKAIRRLGLDPWVWHMNEGHSAFLTIELMREYVARGLSWREAIEALSPKVCFTTHTPVPAGQDAFDSDLVEMHFWNLRNQLGMSRYEFMRLGQNPNQPDAPFNLTILSLKLARYRNGVSKLHGEVSRHLWRDVWPEVPAAEIPITSVTNGVHTGTWIAPQMAALYDKYLTPAWRLTPDKHAIWDNSNIPAAEMWSVHQELKQKMIEAVHRFGIIPFFKGAVSGWSIEELTAPGCWFDDGPDSVVLGPWDWKIDVVREGNIAYGKFLGGKAAFATVQWYKELMNWRRSLPRYRMALGEPYKAVSASDKLF